MGLILVPGDFSGKYKISQNSFQSTDFGLYIDKYEKKYLIDLLGVELYKLFAANITNHVPVTQLFIDIFDPILEDENRCVHESEGIKIMLLGFIWLEWCRDSQFKNTVSGTVTNQSEIAKNATADSVPIYGRYNESIASFDTIQWFIRKNLTVYPTYNGQHLGIAHWCL